MERPFRTSWTELDFVSAATVAVVAGQYVELGRVTVPAGVGLALGFGGTPGQGEAEGRIRASLNTSVPAAIQGRLRFTLNDPQDRVLETLYESRTEAIRPPGTADTRGTFAPFPFINAIASRSRSLVAWLRADAAATVSRAHSPILVEGTSFTDPTT